MNKKYKVSKIFKVILLAVLVVSLEVTLAFIKASIFAQPSTSEVITPVPSPLDIEEFNRQHCQLEVDADNQVNVYCKGE